MIDKVAITTIKDSTGEADQDQEKEVTVLVNQANIIDLGVKEMHQYNLIMQIRILTNNNTLVTIQFTRIIIKIIEIRNIIKMALLIRTLKVISMRVVVVVSLLSKTSQV